MLATYLATMIFGGILVGASMLFGGEDAAVDADLDADVDVDLDVDVDADVDVSHDVGDMVAHAGGAASDALWLPFLSLRFWTFALMSFGMTGTLLHFLVGITAIVLPLAIVMGLGIGTSASYVFKRLKTDTVTAETRIEQYIGVEARVLLTVGPERQGKIVIDSLAGQIELMASTLDPKDIPRGSRVLIANVKDGRADVTALFGEPGVPPRQPERSRS